MEIEFLVSTVNRTNLDFLVPMFQHMQGESYRVLVINQCIAIPLTVLKPENPAIRCISVAERGLSKSRNLAIKNAVGELCVIADDDVVFLPGTTEIISKAFTEQEADLVQLQVRTPDNSPYKNYRNQSFVIRGQLQLMRISSIEIVFKRKPVVANGCWFNEQMGLGADYTAGEEILFLHSCFKKKLRLVSVPVPFVVHPKESSGKVFHRNNVLADGILFARLFPFLFLLVDLYFSLKRYKRYRGSFSFLSYFYTLFSGNMLALRGKV